MLSYLHEFHAGNHADILKHVTLLYVLEYLNKKNKPYSFFDTHAGAGLYELDSDEALKNRLDKKDIADLLHMDLETYKKTENQLLKLKITYIFIINNILYFDNIFLQTKRAPSKKKL